jgi:transposase-like protein
VSGKKGMKHYPEELKEQVRQEYESGASMRSLSRKYGISMYSVESWCGKRPEVNLRQTAPLKRGRPSSERTIEDYKQENKRLKMENDLLRNFLSLTERK